MAGSVKAKTPSPKNVPYTVSGDTLADIWADIEKKGPKVNGKNRAGKTVAEGDANPNYGFKLKEDKAKGVFICDLATSVVNIAKQAEDADKKKAQATAVSEWETDVLAKIDKSTIESRLEKVNKALDSKSGHGPTLDTSIP